MVKLAGMIDPAKVKRLREANGWTMDEIARRAGLANRQTWNRYESGERIDPPISVVRAMAKAMGCKIEDLLADPGDNGSSSSRH